MKKRILVALCALMFVLQACGPKAPAEPASSEAERAVISSERAKEANKDGMQQYTPGTYTGTGRGMNGEVQVEVEVDANTIRSIRVKEQNETYGVGYGFPTAPVESLPDAIVNAQGLGVDMVTGATITSRAIVTAVEEALTQAGGSMEALRAVQAPASYASESYEADVIVVGAGAAGMSAAIEAGSRGAKVLVLEKQGIPGGATTLSGGKLVASGTRYQEEQGFSGDTPEALFEYFQSVGGASLDAQRVRFFTDHALETVQWLEQLGIKMINVEPIHSSITPWRVINVEGGGGQTAGHGGQITVPLYQTMKQYDVQVLYNCSATELLTDDAAVRGVRAQYPNGAVVEAHAPSVILATGGYAQNRELTAYLGIEEYSTGVPKGNVGDGLRMGEAVGAKVEQAPGIQEVFVNPATGVGIQEESGLIVTDDGRRVVNEYTYQSHVASALHKAGAKKAYYIASKQDPNPSVQRAIQKEKTPRSETVEGLAKQIGADPATLSTTVERYQALCEAGVDEDFQKPAAYLQPLEAPYYAIELLPSYTVTFGGLVTDMDARVCRENGDPIPGLYAAGEVAFSGLFGEEYPSCGLAIGASVLFGRIAGEQALKDAKGQVPSIQEHK